jgi:rRNA-processing protein FCF1
MKSIILDTNFLLVPAQLKIDIFSEMNSLFPEKIQLFIVNKSLKELDKIASEGRQKEKLQVKLTKALLKTQNIKILACDQEGSVDDLLVAFSKKGYIIATQDQELKRRIRHNLLSIRQKQYVIFRE